MKICLVGATGNIGSRILEESMRRDHEITGTTRNADNLKAQKNITPYVVNTQDVDGLSKAIAACDMAIFAVKWNENKIENAVEAMRKSGKSRALFVVGAGSLTMENGKNFYDQMVDQGITPPPTSKPAMEALEYLRSVNDLEWTAISPPARIVPGTRTGHFELGRDTMLRPTKGEEIAMISMEDFAVAVMDEVENPQHLRMRFTAAN